MHFHNKLNQAEENLNHRLKQNTSLQIYKLHLIFIGLNREQNKNEHGEK